MVRQHQTSDAQLRIGESRNSGLDAEPVIGPRFARTHWHRPGMTGGALAPSLATPYKRSSLREGTMTMISLAKLQRRIDSGDLSADAAIDQSPEAIGAH